MKNKKFGGKFVICNLQPTKYDKKADLVISTYVDAVMEKVAKRLGVEIPEYSKETDPTKVPLCETEWTIPNEWVKEISAALSEKTKEAKKRKSEQMDDAREKLKKSSKSKIEKAEEDQKGE